MANFLASGPRAVPPQKEAAPNVATNFTPEEQKLHFQGVHQKKGTTRSGNTREEVAQQQEERVLTRPLSDLAIGQLLTVIYKKCMRDVVLVFMCLFSCVFFLSSDD